MKKEDCKVGDWYIWSNGDGISFTLGKKYEIVGFFDDGVIFIDNDMVKHRITFGYGKSNFTKVTGGLDMKNVLGMVKSGDRVMCTMSCTDSFTVGKEYLVTGSTVDNRGIHTDCGTHLFFNAGIMSVFKIVKEKDLTESSTHVIISSKVKEKTTAKAITINGTTGGIMNLKALKDGTMVIEGTLDATVLKAGMQVFDELMEKWRNVKSVSDTGFKAGDTNYTLDGKWDARHTVPVINKMRTKLSKFEYAFMIELDIMSKYEELKYVSGQKNFYVVFKDDTQLYSVMSEDKIRRIDTIHMSRVDAFKVKKELNALLK